MTATPPDRYAVDRLIRQVAAAAILPRFRNLAEDDIREKKPGDLVTAADEDSERRLTAALPDLLPGSRVVGEEAASRDEGVLAALDGPDPVWVVDPVDGTHNFAHGKDRFAVIVALCQHGAVTAAWIHGPTDGTTVWAAPGQGAWRLDEPEGPRRLAVNPARPLPDMTGSLGYRWRKKVQQAREAERPGLPAKVIRAGCTGWDYADLALGRLDFAQYTRLKPWDHAAGILIHAEAGGYNALTEDGAAYRVTGQVDPRTILLAPDRASWQAMKDLLESL